MPTISGAGPTDPGLRLPLGGRALLFVGGKGGVGKTTTAAALGLELAEQRGERILLVSTDPAHSLGDLFDRRLGDRETVVAEGPGGGVLAALEVDPEAETDRYLKGVREAMRAYVRPALYDEVERQIGLTRQTPGAAEAALMDRVATLMDEGPMRWDRVLFDTAPTGHTLRLLALPELMAAWTDGLLRQRERSDRLGAALRAMGGGRRKAGEQGEADRPTDDLALLDTPGAGPSDPRLRRIHELLLERRRRFSRARRLLLDPARVGFLFVLIPEKLPLLETRMALGVLQEHKVPVLGMVVNRVLPAGELGAFLEARREQEGRWLRRIDDAFAPFPRVRVPLQRDDVEGLPGLRLLAEALR